MIKSVIMYKVVCDRCGEEYFYDIGQTDAFSSVKEAEDYAFNDGWIKIGDKHYCYNCSEYDGKNDIYKVKEK